MSSAGNKPPKISIEEVEKIAILARLAPSESEKSHLSGEMSDILGFMEQLSELDTTHVEPLHHVLELNSVLRDDVVTPSLPVEEALKNAPHRKGDYFVVPKVIKGTGE